MDTIFFDLDGTLTDPKPGITRSLQYALERLGRPVPAQDELTWCIGPPLRTSLVKLLGGEEDADRGVALYRERFGDVGLFENSLYPEIEATLAALKPRARLFVATSKAHVYADRIIDHFGLRPHFEYVFGAELDGTRAHKGDLLAFALERTGTDPARAVMIGDRSHDIVGARVNGIGGIGVLYGYGSREELTEAGAAHLCATPRAIRDHLHAGPG
ncbi:HAD family hydrolase [Bradyrhizobium sp.]|uniref:HAD family hydrolase n=1 Tax=Bradyrhizobium sp. TaxID=376 RepID=UPI001E1A2133|nr:HAD family hydrolase [Bradyrhizobium sp.]MBI5320534.1 HAD family hydrolase [Bradyrhizobium sp.]